MKKSTDLPYDKFINYGPKSLSDTELLAIILKTGCSKMDVIELASNILSATNENNRLIGLQRFSFEDLVEFEGIGKIKAITIRALIEILERMSLESREDKIVFNSPELISSYYMESMRHLEYEKVKALYLDAKSRLLKDVDISIGNVSQAIVSAREVYIEALKNKAVNVIIIHNHPSGIPEPSLDDIVITNKLKDAGKVINIPLLDHIIIGDNIYYSMRQNGYI